VARPVALPVVAVVAVVAAALAHGACDRGAGLGAAPSPPPSDAAPPRACGPADPVACVEARQASCVAGGDKAYRLATGNLGTVTVSAVGLLRLDFGGKQMFGVDGHDWLACMPTCPGGAATPVCIPYHFKLTISGEVEPACAAQPTEPTTWHDRPAQRLRWSCPSATIEMLLVPELVPARDALLEVGAIASRSRLAQLDGLVVQMKVGTEVVFDIGSVDQVPCRELEIPAGHRRVDKASDFAAMRELAPEAEQNFRAATSEGGKRLSASILAEGQAHAVELLGRRCLGERAQFDAAAVQACLAKHPEIPVQQVVGNAVMAVANRRANEQIRVMTDAIRTHVDEPLCRRFAPMK
jgi:hypothetical protein